TKANLPADRLAPSALFPTAGQKTALIPSLISARPSRTTVGMTLSKPLCSFDEIIQFEFEAARAKRGGWIIQGLGKHRTKNYLMRGPSKTRPIPETSNTMETAAGICAVFSSSIVALIGPIFATSSCL